MASRRLKWWPSLAIYEAQKVLKKLSDSFLSPNSMSSPSKSIELAWKMGRVNRLTVNSRKMHGPPLPIKRSIYIYYYIIRYARGTIEKSTVNCSPCYPPPAVRAEEASRQSNAERHLVYDIIWDTSLQIPQESRLRVSAPIRSCNLWYW